MPPADVELVKMHLRFGLICHRGASSQVVRRPLCTLLHVPAEENLRQSLIYHLVTGGRVMSR
jgi:hypothetical protein